MTTAPVLLELGRGPGPHRIVLLPPVGGGIFPYLGLSAFLERYGTVFAMRGLGLYPGEEPDVDVPTMVDRYLNLLPGRPDLLLGWSLGGVLAWELAARLATPDTGAPAVAMVDSFAQFPCLSAGEHDALIDQIASSGPVPLAAEEKFLLRRTAIAHVRAAAAHEVVTEFDGDVLLVSCTADLPAQWAPRAHRLRTRHVDCSHFDAISPPHLPVLVRHVEEFIMDLAG